MIKSARKLLENNIYVREHHNNKKWLVKIQRRSKPKQTLLLYTCQQSATTTTTKKQFIFKMLFCVQSHSHGIDFYAIAIAIYLFLSGFDPLEQGI